MLAQTYDMALDAKLKEAYCAIELDIWDSYNQGPEAWTALASRFRILTTDAMNAVRSGSVTPDTCKLIRIVTGSISIFSTQFADLERRAREAEATIKTEFRSLISLHPQNPRDKQIVRGKAHKANPSAKTKNNAKENTASESTPEVTKFKPCRDYFFANLAYPYPSLTDKRDMAREVGCAVNSVNQWFTNNRRRSGWMTIMKDHAQNDKIEMRRLVETVLSNSSSSKCFAPEVREAVLAMRSYIEKLAVPTISPIFLEAMKMKPLTNEELEEYKAEKRKIRREKMEAKKEATRREERRAQKEARIQARAERRAQAEALGAEVAPAAGKRKRGSEDSPADDENEPQKKKRSAADTLLTRKLFALNFRYVSDEVGNLRRLRRSRPLRPSILNGQKMPDDDEIGMITQQKRKRSVEDDDSSPRLPSEHKRRRQDTNSAEPSVEHHTLPMSCDVRSVSAPILPRSQDTLTTADWNETRRVVSAPTFFPPTTSFPGMEHLDPNLLADFIGSIPDLLNSGQPQTTNAADVLPQQFDINSNHQSFDGAPAAQSESINDHLNAQNLDGGAAVHQDIPDYSDAQLTNMYLDFVNQHEFAQNDGGSLPSINSQPLSVFDVFADFAGSPASAMSGEQWPSETSSPSMSGSVTPDDISMIPIETESSAGLMLQLQGIAPEYASQLAFQLSTLPTSIAASAFM